MNEDVLKQALSWFDSQDHEVIHDPTGQEYPHLPYMVHVLGLDQDELDLLPIDKTKDFVGVGDSLELAIYCAYVAREIVQNETSGLYTPRVRIAH